MIKIQIVLRLKEPKWCKGTNKDRQHPHKYEILTDDSDHVINRSRRHIKAYLNKSGRMSKPSKHPDRKLDHYQVWNYCKISHKTEGICVDSIYFVIEIFVLMLGVKVINVTC